ncbi:unnamed protein product [Mytilus edulis]|uniref:IRG-type G domain-containing protein n=1 Tax=Mytilus edulis TaxID=6550 RepID=A0A8S3SG71_MYTED|nr:unnamed protein product [Mytilus edulis]
MSTQRSGETSCIGQIDGKQCRTFLRKDTKFCSNCGTRNPVKMATDDQVKSADTNQNEQEKATVYACSSEKGPEASIRYIKDTKDSWKKTTVKIAVTGKSAVGKSAFINAIRGVNKTDKGYATEGVGDTTMEVQEFPHPKNKQIIYCDLPGYGTVTITREKFLEKVKLSDFDMFLIFVYPVPTEDDDWLVKQLNKAGRQFCFVRAKLDRDIKNAVEKWE